VLKFAKLDRVDNLQEFIKDNFEVELPVSGGWGESKEEAVEIKDAKMPIKQIEHIFATIKANIQMHLLLPKEDRFGGINLKEVAREKDDIYDIVEYEIEAIKEDIYAKLIDEYKEGYGKDDFDMEAHFKKREDATFRRRDKIYFKIID